MGCQLTQLKTLYTELVFALSLTELLYTVSSPEFCVHRTSQTLYVNGAARNGKRCTELTSFAHTYATLSYQTSVSKHKFKDKIGKHFKIMTTEHKTRHWPLLSTRPPCDSPSHMPIKPVQVLDFLNDCLIFIMRKT